IPMWRVGLFTRILILGAQLRVDSGDMGAGGGGATMCLSYTTCTRSWGRIGNPLPQDHQIFWPWGGGGGEITYST
ncbi:hypothetical protein F4809DRAFT_630638, partial [Biscogniauxia mediterranea]